MELSSEIDTYYLDNGQVILLDDQNRIIILGEDGNRFYLDKNSEMIAVEISDEPCLNDVIGNAVSLDADNTIYYHDKLGNLIRHDEDGYPYYLNEDVQEIYYHSCPDIYIDGFGKPQKPFPKWIKVVGVLSIVFTCIQGFLFFSQQSEKNRLHKALVEARATIEAEGISPETQAAVDKLNAARAARAARSQVSDDAKTRTLEDIDFNSFSKELAKFTGLKAGQSRGEAVDNVRLYFAPEQGSQIISTSQSTFEREDGAVLLFSASGLPDDSVKAEEIYLILSGDKGAQTLAAYGSRIKCHRGENTTHWTTKLCP